MSARRLAPLAAAIVSFALYLLTLNPTFGFIDKGELVAAASTLGIPHPTGYPTTMMLGWIATKLLPVRPVLALNMLSAFLAASGVAMLAVAFGEIVRRLRLEAEARVRRRADASKRSQKKQRDASPDGGRQRKATRGAPRDAGRVGAGAARVDTVAVGETSAALPSPQPDGASAAFDSIVAAGGALFVGMTATWWNQANGFEVYSLQALLLGAVLYLFMRYVHRVVDPIGPAADAREARRLRALFALLLGVAFTNHLTIILLAPGFLVYFGWSWARRRTGDRSLAGSLRELGRLAPWFLAGLLPYLYLPLRAAQSPLFNWGDPDSFKRFVDHVRGRQYAIWFMKLGDVFTQQAGFFFGKLPSEIGYIGLVMAAIGVVTLARRSARMSVMTALMFAVCVFWAGGYDILEIEPYYMLAVLAIGLWSVIGALWLAERFGRGAALGAIGLLAAVTIAVNFERADERSNTLVEDMAINMLATLPKDAVIISSQWDFWLSGSWYLQAVEGMRRDITVIDQELLRRSWYLDQMATWDPGLMKRIEPSVDRFRHELYKFEHDLPFDTIAIDVAYVGMINALIDSAMTDRPVLVTGEVPAEMGGKHRRIPNYLALRLVSDSAYVAQDFPNYRFHKWNGRVDHYAAKAYELYARSSYARALYEAESGRVDDAQRYFEHALSFDPAWTPDDVADQALNSEEQTYGTIEFFSQLRAMQRSPATKQ